MSRESIIVLGGEMSNRKNEMTMYEFLMKMEPEELLKKKILFRGRKGYEIRITSIESITAEMKRIGLESINFEKNDTLHRINVDSTETSNGWKAIFKNMNKNKQFNPHYDKKGSAEKINNKKAELSLLDEDEIQKIEQELEKKIIYSIDNIE